MKCPFCNSDRVHDNEWFPEEKWTLQCDSCGAQKNNGKWAKTCDKCHKKVEELHGLFVPHLCEECNKKEVEHDRNTGNICLMCRLPRSQCCC